MTTKIGLYKAGSQWRVRWFGRYDPATNKQKRYSKTFDRKKDAEKFRESKKEEFKQGSTRDPSTDTLQEYGNWWLTYRAPSQGLRPATIDLYKLTLNRLYGYFGESTLLRHITAQSAEMFLAQLQPLNGNAELSRWTRHGILRQCKTLFGDAVERDFISKNPFHKLKGPKTSVTPWYYLKPEQYKELLRVTPTVREKVFYSLAYTAGLRLTEALALRWSDIDFNKEELSVINRDGTDTLPPFHIKDYEVRTIPLPTHTIRLLLELQPEAPDNVPYVILTKDRLELIMKKWQRCKALSKPWYNRYYANNMQRNFRERIRIADIRKGGRTLTIHTLRKCCCQNWIQQGLPINVVKQLMGHSDIKTTEKYYSQLTDEQKAQAAAAGNRALEKTDHKMTFSPILDGYEVDNTNDK